MDYRKSEKLFSAACYLCIALVVVSTFLEIRWLSAAGLGILVLGVLQMLLFYKCPHCGARLSLRDKKPAYCPECGEKLKN